jgi:DNA-binding transcriptional ArsR family regulator
MSTQLSEQKNTKQRSDRFEVRPLEKIFHSASARIVDFLLIYREFDYSEADIARKIEMTPKTVGKEIPILLEEGVVKLTRKSGRSNMYKINDSEKVRGLIQYLDGTIDSRYDKFTNTTSNRGEETEASCQ